jgi:hypothetical protein
MKVLLDGDPIGHIEVVPIDRRNPTTIQQTNIR